MLVCLNGCFLRSRFGMKNIIGEGHCILLKGIKGDPNVLGR